MIEAAGGVVWRQHPNGPVEVLLVHRPRYDDWSLPKGKLEAGERHLEAALREVDEETGLRCRAREELDPVRYRDRKGRVKRVRYWAMEVLDGDFQPNHEVDEVRWVPVGRIAEVATYPRDARVVAGLGQLSSAR